MSDKNVEKVNLKEKIVKKYCNKYFLNIPAVLGLCFIAYKIGYNKANKKIINNIISRQSVAIVDKEHGTGTLFLNNN